MAKANRPVAAIPLTAFTLDVKLLSLNSRTLTATNVSCGAGAPVGATSISVSSSVGVNYTIAAGTSLSFVATINPLARQHVLLVEDATLSGTTPVDLKVAPLVRSIPTNSTARLVQDMFPVLGITSLGPQPSPTVVDTTHAQSGSGTSSAIVRIKRELSVEGNEFEGDIALEQMIKRTFNDPSFVNRELYAIATYPNGARFEGPTKVTALTTPATAMEIMKYTFTLEFQDEVIWSPAYYSPTPAAGLAGSTGFPAYNQ